MHEQSLIEAVERDDAARVKSLLAAGANANTSSNGGATALMRAATKGNSAVVEALLRGGAEIESKRGDGMTALMLASFFGHTGVVATLLHHRADVSAQDQTSMTALTWAQAKGHMVVCALLKGTAVGNDSVPHKNSPPGVGSVPGIDAPQAAAGAIETTREESWKEEIVEASPVVSRRPPPAESAPEDPVVRRDRRAQKVAPRHGAFSEGFLFDAGASARVTRLRYYVGATCVIVFFITGILYSFTEGFKNVPAARSARPVQPQTPLPAVQSPPAGVQPESAQPLPTQTPTQLPAVRTSEGRSATPIGGIVEPRLPPTKASVPRKPEIENFEAGPVDMGAVKQTEAEPESPVKPEVRRPAGQAMSENSNEVRSVMQPRALPPQNKEQRSEPAPARTPVANPSYPTKKKVIPWP